MTRAFQWAKRLGSRNRRKSADLNRLLLGQKGQVQFLINQVYGYPRKGLPRNRQFVELAAGHPIRHSNTYFLERYLGWSGLLIEPQARLATELRRHRTSRVLETYVGRETGKKYTFIERGMRSGFVGEHYDNDFDGSEADVVSGVSSEVTAQSLNDILYEMECPPLIDYLSLDVEGAELEIMRDFEFSRWRFMFMSIERPKVELEVLLDSAGYVQVGRSRWDTYYVHSSFLDERLLGVADGFALTDPKPSTRRQEIPVKGAEKL